LSRYLDQQTAKGPLRSSSKVSACYYHSKVEAIPLSALPKDTTGKLAGLSPHYIPFKCWRSSRKVV